MHDIAAPAPFAPVARRRDPGKGKDLMRLAREVESSQPAHAIELLGMAMHDSRAAAVPVAPARDAWWRRAGRAVWSGMLAYGEARAQRDILMLADRWELSQPELAKELRAACARRG